MKTKFDALLSKLKQEIQICEQEIMQINALLSQTQQEIQNLMIKMEQIPIPNHGDFSIMKDIFEGKKAYLSLIDEAQEKLSALKYQKAQKQAQYKLHQLEFEKIQYLHQKEIQNKIQTLKAQEAKLLDDIASARFYQQQGGR